MAINATRRNSLSSRFTRACSVFTLYVAGLSVGLRSGRVCGAVVYTVHWLSVIELP